MKTLTLIAAFFLLILTVYGNQSISDSIFNEYKKINDSDTRLQEFKDTDKILKLKLIQLQVINKSRAKRKLKPVKLDILASRVANKISKEASEAGFISHWNTAGEKPYHRYAFAGGLDHITENAYGESEFSKSFTVSFGYKDVKDSIHKKFNTSPFNNDNTTILYYMKKAHKEFMSEKAPADGHKRNILNKWHNYVGIGFYMGKNNFRYYEEFIDRYYEFEEVTTIVKKNEEFTIRLTTKEGWYLCYLVATREKKLKKKTPFFLNFKGSYKDYSPKKAMKITPWELLAYREGQTYEFKLKFKKPGLYYFHIYQDNKEYKKLNFFNTMGKCQASGIVIRVEK